MDKKSKNTLIVSIIALALVLIGVTYAYFSARITGLENASMLQLTAGRMGIVYSEGNDEFAMNNIYPREEEWVTKTFTLTGTNTTDQTMNYKVGLQIINSTFPAGYLTYDLVNTTATSGTPIPNRTNALIGISGTTWFGSGLFNQANGDTHSYTLKIYFKDNGKNQNDAQGAIFSARIVINEVIESNRLVYGDTTKLYSYNINYDGCLNYLDGLNWSSSDVQKYCSDSTPGNGYSLYGDIINGSGSYLESEGVITNLRSNIASYDINYENCLDYMDDEWGMSVADSEIICTGGTASNYNIDNQIILGEAAYFVDAGVLENITYVDNTARTLKEFEVGDEYVDGQYKYIYKAIIDELDHHNWWNSYYGNVDGWRVEVIDPTSTAPITTRPLTSINGIPVVSAISTFAFSQATSIDFSGWNTSNMIDMSGMFTGSAATSIDLSSFDTSKVTNMSDMFRESSATSINLSSFDTSNVADMRAMFQDSNATTLDLSTFNTSNVTRMDNMFSGSAATNINVRSFDTSNVTTMNSMFRESAINTLDLSSFDFSAISDANYMFMESTDLTTIYSTRNFDGIGTTLSGIYMFTGCTSLIGGNGTHYNSSYVDKIYARIDAPGTPGYFTLKN